MLANLRQSHPNFITPSRHYNYNEILNQIEYITALRKLYTTNGLLIGFWYLDTFSVKGITNKTPGICAIDKIPMNLSDKIRNKLNVGKRYHSGTIWNGVANGDADELTFKGSVIPNPNNEVRIPEMTIGKMYKISLGHAGSP